MGSDQSRISREQARLEKERKILHQFREEQLQEALRLEKEKNLYHRAREELAVKALEAQKLQDALRISNTGTQNQLYPNLNPIATTFRNETYQNNAAPHFTINHDNFRFQPSVASAPLAPTVCQAETRAPPPRPRLPITNKPATERAASRERQTTTQTVKCPNTADGCRLSFHTSKLAEHEKECPFRELKCPSLGYCHWRGKLPQLSTHFDEEHPTSRQANVDTEMFLQNIDNDYNALQLINMGTYNFLFYVKVSKKERMVYMDIQFIGTKISASKWYYEIHVYNKSEPRRKYRYIDSCHSVNDIQGISLNSCAVLPLPYAMSFVNEDKLTYKIFIKKNFNQNKRPSCTAYQGVA